MRALTSGSVTEPRLAVHTIWSVSPAWAENSRLSRSVTRWDSVPGSVKLLEYLVPRAPEAANVTTNNAIQAEIARPGCLSAERATRATNPSFSSEAWCGATIIGLRSFVRLYWMQTVCNQNTSN